MALDNNALSTSIQSNLTSAGYAVIAQNKVLCDAIAKAVVDHIKSNAEVNGTDSQNGAIEGTVS